LVRPAASPSKDCVARDTGGGDEVIFSPECPEHLRPVLAGVPVQRLAYPIAFQRGRDIDRPHNLVKSVTAECPLA
jgi:glucosamine 6-phosphate synthetase-like amidotransferase/phosphosugar isomerase protein